MRCSGVSGRLGPDIDLLLGDRWSPPLTPVLPAMLAVASLSLLVAHFAFFGLIDHCQLKACV